MLNLIGFQTRIKVRKEFFVSRVNILLNSAATTIQKCAKRNIVRAKFKKIMKKEKLYPCIKWRHGGKSVCVVGEMSKPQWAHKIKLKYCPLRRIHYKYFKIEPGKQYKYLYIVDGKYCYDESLPCIGNDSRCITNYLQTKGNA